MKYASVICIYVLTGQSICYAHVLCKNYRIIFLCCLKPSSTYSSFRFTLFCNFGFKLYVMHEIQQIPFFKEKKALHYYKRADFG